ncbi:MAG: RNA polymerase sigma factor [Verrucomicrobiales bacterium]
MTALLRLMADDFLTTRWSQVQAAAGPDPRSARALEALCRQAWRPLYAYARRWGCSREDAEDVVQGFISALLSRRSLERTAPGQGRFRTFLLAGLRNHLSDRRAHASARKRGGGTVHVSLDAEAAERGYLELATTADSPERVFERVWAMALVEKARGRLGEECAASGKAAVFAALLPSSAESPAENYRDLALRLGLSETALRSLAMRLRRRWRDLIRAELAETVSNKAALEEEMLHLRAALRD